ncbi:MAG: DUF1697 domain-containing protein, partial [Chloroflexi bacterium]|nr:DUF1697 domain-containing protein [Chloroflexota bacterium]
MKTYIVLLRGVMPTGKNKVPMAQLREVLAKDGFGNARTYIQSGNALVDTDLPAKELEKRIHQLIRKHIGADLAVVARTRTQLQKILHENPFAKGHDISRVFFVSFAEPPSVPKVKDLLVQNFSPEKLVIVKDAAYMYIPGTYGRGRLSNNFLEKKLGVPATTRNFNTLSKL